MFDTDSRRLSEPGMLDTSHHRSSPHHVLLDPVDSMRSGPTTEETPGKSQRG